LWPGHSCLPCSHSCEHVRPAAETRSHECERCTHECVRHGCLRSTHPRQVAHALPLPRPTAPKQRLSKVSGLPQSTTKQRWRHPEQTHSKATPFIDQFTNGDAPKTLALRKLTNARRGLFGNIGVRGRRHLVRQDFHSLIVLELAVQETLAPWILSSRGLKLRTPDSHPASLWRGARARYGRAGFACGPRSCRRVVA
jgi:hypothetical protein